MSERQRLTARVYGLVQGVNFRSRTLRRAIPLRLTGYVRNSDDGTVEVIAEGSRTELEELLRWLQGGPPAARVERVEASWGPATGEYRSFEIRY